MSRINRFDYLHDGCIVHVRMQINNGESHFQKKEHFKLWKKWTRFYLKKYPTVKLNAYQWMNTHYHLILRAEKAIDLTKFLHDINWRMAFTMNKILKRKGHFFQARYKCSVIDKDEYELSCQRYIHRNQIRAKMVPHVKNSYWSSYQHYAYGKPDEIITPFRNYANFGREIPTRQKQFRIYVETMSDWEEHKWKQRLNHHQLKTKKDILKNYLKTHHVA